MAEQRSSISHFWLRYQFLKLFVRPHMRRVTRRVHLANQYHVIVMMIRVTVRQGVRT